MYVCLFNRCSVMCVHGFVHGFMHGYVALVLNLCTREFERPIDDDT
nr:MAG TPA: hypothetical protein [Caudoviricetes sp.]